MFTRQILLILMIALATTGCSAGSVKKSIASLPEQTEQGKNSEDLDGANPKDGSLFPGQNNDSDGKHDKNELSAEELADMIKSKKDITIIDVGTPGEYKEGHIAGSIHAEISLLRKQTGDYLASLKIDKERTIILVCETGNKSFNTVPYLLNSGYLNVYNLKGGKVAWLRSGFELVRD